MLRVVSGLIAFCLTVCWLLLCFTYGENLRAFLRYWTFFILFKHYLKKENRHIAQSFRLNTATSSRAQFMVIRQDILYVLSVKFLSVAEILPKSNQCLSSRSKILDPVVRKNKRTLKKVIFAIFPVGPLPKWRFSRQSE